MRIVGFGACLIGGVGVGKDFSFFSQCIRMLNSNKVICDFNEIVSLPAFPITRAYKYLDKKVLSLNPDIVVIQLATTDISINIQKVIRKKFSFINKPINNNGHLQIKSLEDSFISKTKIRFKLLLKNLIAYLLRIKPITQQDIYISCLEEMIIKLKEKGIIPVVLSPFRTADYFTDVRALKYMKEMDRLSQKHKFIFLDCFSLFKKCKISDFLLSDGLHLSKKGHLMVAEKLSERLKMLQVTNEQQENITT